MIVKSKKSKPLYIKMLRCKRCGYKWYPRKPGHPIKCAKCDDPNWNIPRIYKKRTIKEDK